MDRNFVLALALSMLVVMIYTSTRPPVEEPPLTQPAPNESAVAEEGKRLFAHRHINIGKFFVAG